jgi:hypothetical protein
MRTTIMRSGYDVGNPIRGKEIRALKEVEFRRLVSQLEGFGITLKSLQAAVEYCTREIATIKKKLEIT